MAFVTLLFLFFSKPIINIFSNEASVISYGAKALQIIAAGYVFYGIGMVMIQALNGAGDTKTPTWINFFGFWVFQIPLAYLLSGTFNLGSFGIFIAIVVTEAFVSVTSVIIFRRGKWKLVKI